ncbi:unnamed protein product [Bursaphelenchus xylophilus]|uniref:(pine wood nematode) hypothetical protein n=1 Tax=Bursaphelenchus xylophilus TaxID=6326 RepID=A0A1I7RLG1_BURXY|nr:unnamed protein product [Bursaphelenchus xylophilus]CAG9083019.1 unnamed protein product [Bursaphelenchus xylophilus]
MSASSDPFNFKIPKNIEFGDVGADDDVFNKTNGWGSPEFYAQRKAAERQKKLEAIDAKLRRLSALKDSEKENQRSKNVIPVKPVNSNEGRPVLQPSTVRTRASSQPPVQPVVSAKPVVQPLISRLRSNSMVRTPAAPHGMELRGRPQERKVPAFVRQAVKATPTLSRSSPLVRRAAAVTSRLRNSSQDLVKPAESPAVRSVRGIPVVAAYHPGKKAAEKPKEDSESKENQKPTVQKSLVQPVPNPVGRVLRSFSQPRQTPTPATVPIEKKPMQSTPKALPIPSRLQARPPAMPRIVRPKNNQENVPSRVDASGADVLNKKPVNRRFSFMAPTFASRRRSMAAPE